MADELASIVRVASAIAEHVPAHPAGGGDRAVTNTTLDPDKLAPPSPLIGLNQHKCRHIISTNVDTNTGNLQKVVGSLAAAVQSLAAAGQQNAAQLRDEAAARADIQAKLESEFASTNAALQENERQDGGLRGQVEQLAADLAELAQEVHGQATAGPSHHEVRS